MSRTDLCPVEKRIPLAYLITFRCYGTWLPGDERGSTNRLNNCYGASFILPNRRWYEHNLRLLKQESVELDAIRRAEVEVAIQETCEIRNWLLLAINVRTNHVHIVVSAVSHPESILKAFKANATRRMREAKCWRYDRSPWSHGGSKRYLWTEGSIERAIDYVVHGQGDKLPDDL